MYYCSCGEPAIMFIPELDLFVCEHQAEIVRILNIGGVTEVMLNEEDDPESTVDEARANQLFSTQLVHGLVSHEG